MAEVEAIFIGANRQTHIADIHFSRKIIAFGAGKTVALWNPISPNANGVYSTLKGHGDEVTSVRFIPGSDFLITASEDSSVKVWKFKEEKSNHMEFVQSLDVHHVSVTSIGVYNDLFVTGDTDGHILIWKLNKQEGKVEQLHAFNSQVGVLPLSLAIQEIEPNQYILALGGTKFQIFIYSFTLTKLLSEFQHVASLEGHEDWVKALAFKKQTDGDYLLASGSQDRYIRLWRIRTNDLIDRSDEDETKLTLLSNKQYKFSIDQTKVAINFEALIMGHDDWISSLSWHSTELKLLASSADTAMMVWQPDDVSGIWICSSRLGEISSKGASTATGSSGGFWASIWFNDDSGTEYIATNGKTGAWRLWKAANGEDGGYEQILAISGATRHATDISWSTEGDYLLSTSLDQTTRLYAEWKYEADGSSRETPTWQEFARPQIHGYDMICVSTLSSTRFISGGDEKILRSFDEPRGVANVLEKFCGIIKENEIMLESASLPALGLSNKATSDAESLAPNQTDSHQFRETDDTNNISFQILNSLDQPPFEDHLQRHTLWPEIEKLYGHGYEIISVDTSPDKKLVASSCRSNTQQHAVVRIFDSSNWQELKPNLKLHDLTVTRVKFSDDGKYLLTVSRDRQFGLWKRDIVDDSFELVAKNEKAHTRIIWDCSWFPLEAGYLFVTGSRDKTIKIWSFDGEKVELLQTGEKYSSPVTAVDVHKHVVNGKMLIAVGLEDGSVHIHSYEDGKLSKMMEFDDNITPAGRISRISWSLASSAVPLLAVASYDNSTRIFKINNLK